MDDRQFDSISRSLASRSTRRQAIRGAGAGAAVLGFFGFRGRPTQAQDDDVSTGLGDDGTCRLDFDVAVRLGPSTAPGKTAHYHGILSFQIGDSGGFTDGTFATDDGNSYPVVGQGSGKSAAFRIHVGNDVIVAVGAGEDSLKACNGEYGGPASGPVRGDLGDWLAVTTAPTSGSTPAANATAATTPVATLMPAPTAPGTTPTAQSTSSASQPTSTPGEHSASACPRPDDCPESTFLWDTTTCTCSCAAPDDVRCFDSCCPHGSVCGDGQSVICSCPDGTEMCGDACVGCDSGMKLDSSSCTCVPA